MSIYKDLINGIGPAEEAHIWNALKGTRNKNPDKEERINLGGTDYDVQIIEYRNLGGRNREYNVIDFTTDKKILNFLCELKSNTATVYLQDNNFKYNKNMIRDFLKYTLQSESPVKIISYKYDNPDFDNLVDSAFSSLGYMKNTNYNADIDEDEYCYTKK